VGGQFVLPRQALKRKLGGLQRQSVILGKKYKIKNKIPTPADSHKETPE
jgi:hypothetical protein